MTDFAAILDAAHKAAQEAVKAENERQPEDMHALDCGFAWVTIDGKQPLAVWCRQQVKLAGGESKAHHMYGHKGYPRGWTFWKPGDFNGQSIRIHRVGSVAFEAKLAEFGIRATVGSRLD